MSGKPDIAVTHQEWAIIHDILQRYLPQHQIWAFGSRARHTHKPFSDLDIVVVSETPVALSTLAALREAFSESDLPWKVDIVDWVSISDAFRHLIESDKVLLQ